MITVVTHLADPDAPDAVEVLADTLGALVAGVAAGLVADAVIVTARDVAAVGTVADATGATLVVPAAGTDPWAAGARAARRDWVLCLEAGDVPAEGWIRTLDRFVGTAPSEVALGRLRRAHAGPTARLAARIERLTGARAPRAGDVVRRDRLGPDGRFAARLAVRRLPARIERA